MGRSDYRANRRIAVFPNRAFPPFFHQTAYVFVHGYAVFQNHILNFRARRIGRLDQNENPFIVLFALFHKGQNTVRAKITVHRHVVGRESLQGVFIDLRFSKERLCIAGRRRADVVALRVRDNHKPLCRRIFKRFIVRLHTCRTVHFIVRDLHLYGRYDIVHVIDDFFIEFEHPFRNVVERFCAELHLVGKIVE